MHWRIVIDRGHALTLKLEIGNHRVYSLENFFPDAVTTCLYLISL